jgi:hypothetical protein
VDAGASDAVSIDAAVSCLDQGLTAGQRYSVSDNCNFCECCADGTTACTTRVCSDADFECEYDGTTHAYGDIFPATDGCIHCSCGASGLACTRRACTVGDGEGAILVESLDTECGVAGFTAQSVLDTLPLDDITTAFHYAHGAIYPEPYPDTTVRFRIVYKRGIAVCRIPSPGQEAFDLEVVLELITGDGTFDEGFHAYLRRDANHMFVNAWNMATSAHAINGTHQPACPDFRGYGFAADVDIDGTAHGSLFKVCEIDIALDVATWSYPP